MYNDTETPLNSISMKLELYWNNDMLYQKPLTPRVSSLTKWNKNE